jgi:hypothetical protein
MGEQEPEPVAADMAQHMVASGAVHFGWQMVAVALVLAGTVGFVWWNNRAAAPLPAAPAVTVAPVNALRPSAQPAATVAVTPAAAVSPLTIAVELPVAQLPTPTLALPTVTPTTPLTTVATRTVTFGGTATLRISLENTAYAGSGRPLDLPLQPRVFVLGGTTTSVTDRWCMQAGIVSLVHTMTLALNPATEAVDVTGSLDLHDGFCDDLGALRTSSPLQVEVPADTTAKLAQSLQTKTGLLGVDDLLNTNIGVFAELMITNSRPH